MPLRMQEVRVLGFRHELLVAHELGHWPQMVAQRPLTPWQAEYGANEIMVAFWREYQAPAHAASTEAGLLNFVAQPQTFRVSYQAASI